MPRFSSNSTSLGNAAIAASSALRYAASRAGSRGASSAAICSARASMCRLLVIAGFRRQRLRAHRSPASPGRACSARCRRSSSRRARARDSDRAPAPGETSAPPRSRQTNADRRAPDRKTPAPHAISCRHHHAPRRCRCEAAPIARARPVGPRGRRARRAAPQARSGRRKAEGTKKNGKPKMIALDFPLFTFHSDLLTSDFDFSVRS